MSKYHSSTGFDLTKSNHGYYVWHLTIGDHRKDSYNPNDPFDIYITADSTDEHSDQNVNWEIVDGNGWIIRRGHSRSVRNAIKNLGALGYLK